MWHLHILWSHDLIIKNLATCLHDFKYKYKKLTKLEQWKAKKWMKPNQQQQQLMGQTPSLVFHRSSICLEDYSMLKVSLILYSHESLNLSFFFCFRLWFFNGLFCSFYILLFHPEHHSWVFDWNWKSKLWSQVMLNWKQNYFQSYSAIIYRWLSFCLSAVSE